MSLRLLLLMDPVIPVPPAAYGGIERVVADLAAGLTARGHEVTLWAGPGSHVPGTVEPFGREGEWTRWSNIRNTLVVTGRLYASPKRFDLVHNFGRLAYLSGILAWDLPKVQTYMRPVNPANMRKVRCLGARRLVFTAASRAVRDTGAPGGGEWHVIYNCASPAIYRSHPDTDAAAAPLVFLGRLERCKGAHHAIAVAKRLKRTLVIAGNISTLADERAYFEQEIQPSIDQRLIHYVGPVNDAQKNEILGNAAALLMPIEWEEPFGIVLPEAMLCGTPAIAFRRGGVPEVVEHGRTGFLCDTLDEMVQAVADLPSLDRRACRAEAERRFGIDAIVSEYERLYDAQLRHS